jgi:hypothetical protein
MAHIPPLYSREEAVSRAKYISEVSYDFFLALRKGTDYLGRAVI